MLDRKYNKVRVDNKLTLGKGASLVSTSDAGVETAISAAELVALNDLSATDLAKIDGITNGTAAAGKALVVGASKEISGITTLGATNVDVGASGTAGSLDVFPGTASKGKLAISCTAQTGDTTVSLVAGAMGAARTITIPDPGAAANVLLTTGAATATSATSAELDALAGAAVGTATASKAVVLDASKNITGLGSVLSTAPTGGGIGYATGAGGAVTQATNRTTGVTLSKLTGQITTNNASLAAEASADFVVTNTTVAAGDVVVVSIQSGSNGGGTIVSVAAVAAGSFTIRVHNGNVAAGTAETGAIVINFAVIKAAAA